MTRITTGSEKEKRHASFILRITTIIVIMALTGCSGTTLKPAIPDRITGYYMNKAESDKGLVKIDESLPITDYKRLIYIKPSTQHFMNDKTAHIDQFAKKMIDNIGFFDQVATLSEFEGLLLKTGIAYKVTNISDMIGLCQVQKLLGNYLVAEFSFKLTPPHFDGTNSVADLVIIDPATMKPVFHVQHRAFIVQYFDQALFYPLFNSFIDWVNRNSVH